MDLKRPVNRPLLGKVLAAFGVAAIAVTLSVASSANAASRCAEIHGRQFEIQQEAIIADAELTRSIYGFNPFMDANGDTTGLRREDKYVESESMIEKILGSVRSLGEHVYRLRDQALPGHKNVTITDYALPIKYDMRGNSFLAAKIRFRKYFNAAEDAKISPENLTPIDSMKDRTWMEFKIDHEDFEQVVRKPRAMVLDADLEMLKDKNLFKQNKKQILARTLALKQNLKSPELVKQFFDFLTVLHNKLPAELPMFAKTAYVRDSHSLTLKDRQGNQTEVQITNDRQIQVTDLRTGQAIAAYSPDDVVEEIKIPLARADLNDNDISEVPGLEIMRAIKANLQDQHNTQFEMGSGKLSTSRRALRNLVGD